MPLVDRVASSRSETSQCRFLPRYKIEKFTFLNDDVLIGASHTVDRDSLI